MKTRLEPFGAWVRLDDPPVLVALDPAQARRLGLEGADLWKSSTDAPTAPLEVHLAVNQRCSVGCAGCYLDATPQGEEPSTDELLGRLRALAEAGVFVVALGGGEPLLRPDLPVLAREARRLGMSPVMTTSGAGLTPERARGLGAFAQVNVSHDGVDGGYEQVRGVAGAAMAERALQALTEAGVRVGINLVLTRRTFDRVEATAARAAALGAREIQLLRYKPSGRAARLDYLERRLQPAQIDTLPALLASLVRSSGLSVRIDCSMIPWLAGSELDPALAERFGVFGCEAGRHLAATTVQGRVAGCSFLDATGLLPGEIAGSYRSQPALAALRSFANAPPEPCASCPWRRVCRGGCRAVAAWYGDSMQPDPECHRVRRHAAEAR
jgi:radical SAM protein with 4Fe4S-binding SPASM domain